MKLCLILVSVTRYAVWITEIIQVQSFSLKCLFKGIMVNEDEVYTYAQCIVQVLADTECFLHVINLSY